MGVKSTVSAIANDRREGMTLAEVEAFVKASQDMQVPGETGIKATIGFNGQIKRLELT